MLERRPARPAPLRTLGAVLLLALAPSVVALPAHADPTPQDKAAALALFDEGRKLAAAKKFAEACPKFEGAMRLDPGMGTLFNLSSCYEEIGRTASAWSGFRDVAAQAKAANMQDREKVARDRAAALEPKLAKLRIVVPAELRELQLTITRDGAEVPSALIGTAVPLDPGEHTIVVSAAGREPFEERITLSSKGGTVDVEVPLLKSVSPEPPAPSATASQTSVAPAETAAPTSSSLPTASPSALPAERPWQKPLGIAATIGGVLGAGAGIAIGFVAKGTFDDSNKEHCDAATDICDAEGIQMRSDAVGLGNISTAVTIAGAVVSAAGILLWITAPSAPAKTGISDLRVGAGPSSLVVNGRF